MTVMTIAMINEENRILRPLLESYLRGTAPSAAWLPPSGAPHTRYRSPQGYRSINVVQQRVAAVVPVVKIGSSRAPQFAQRPHRYGAMGG